MLTSGTKTATAAVASAAIALTGLPAVHADNPLPPVGSGFKFDFGPGTVAEGYTRVDAGTQYSAAGKFGFTDTSVTSGADRGTGDALRSDFVQAQGSTFLVDLPNGDYTVKLVAGDTVEPTNIAITAETMAKVQLTDKPAGQYLEMEFPISLVDGQLNLDFSGTAAKINSLVIAARAPRSATTDPAVYLTGDSTVQTYDPGFVPQAGWGQMIDRYFDGAITFRNHAIGGRSSKNFISQGRLDEVLRVINPGDYLMVQFGHNDATVGVDDRYASPADYKEYLRTYVHGARQRGATPILVTPVGRRDYDEATGKFRVSFPEYVAKMQELAAEENVALVDLSASSRAYYDEIGPEDTKSVFLHVDAGVYPNRPTGTVDNTHFQEYGAIQIARLVAGGVKQLSLPLASRVKEVAPPSSVPAKPQGLVAGSISNAGALLKWQPVDGADIYKVYRKLAAEPDSAYQLTTTSTVPSMMFSRGYYTRAVLAAYDLVGGKIIKRWVFDSDASGAQYRGQGNHNLSVADVDADGKDEFVFGSMTIDDNGKPLYNTGLGHGDAIHTSDFDPSRPGLETFAAHEDMGSSGNRGATFRDSKTGQVLWSIPATRDTGRAAMGDIDPRHPGGEGWAIGGDAAWNSPVGQLRSAKGELIAEKIPAANFLAWWDGDLLREIVDHDWDATASTGTPSVGKWNWGTESTDRLVTASGAKSNNSTKGTPAIQADLLGDWREEIAWPSSDSTELRIYTTRSSTDIRLRTLMHDPVYRLSVARENISYNQPPHPGFFIGDGMERPAQPDIVYTRAG